MAIAERGLRTAEIEVDAVLRGRMEDRRRRKGLGLDGDDAVCSSGALVVLEVESCVDPVVEIEIRIDVGEEVVS